VGPHEGRGRGSGLWPSLSPVARVGPGAVGAVPVGLGAPLCPRLWPGGKAGPGRGALSGRLRGLASQTRPVPPPRWAPSCVSPQRHPPDPAASVAAAPGDAVRLQGERGPSPPRVLPPLGQGTGQGPSLRAAPGDGPRRLEQRPRFAPRRRPESLDGALVPFASVPSDGSMPCAEGRVVAELGGAALG